jgi:hypothetical protein
MPRNPRVGIESRKTISRQKMLEDNIPLGQQQRPEPLISQLDIEIECPRCNEILELCSDFDRLYYFCESCNLHLRVV